MQYSNDLRRKLVEAWQAGHGTQAELAEVFGVSLGWVEKVLRRWRETGDTAAPVFRHGPVSGLDPERVVQLVAQHPAATLAELGRPLKVSPPTLCRWLQLLGLRRKKNHSTQVNVTRRVSSSCGRVGGASVLGSTHSS
jgi:putative transposase